MTFEHEGVSFLTPFLLKNQKMRNYFQCGRYGFDLTECLPLVMGILNITPDSFSDGGKFLNLNAALDQAEKMIEDGADIIDIGGESSRPGAKPVSEQEELDRIMPVIYALKEYGRAISVDTWKPNIMREALIAGVDMINDINAFTTEGAIDTVRDSECALCVMHKKGDSETMQKKPRYKDVVKEVSDYLKERATELINEGIDVQRICLDPGFGFGKTLEHNLKLFKNIGNICEDLGLPVLVGVSRKNMIGDLTGKPVNERAAGSVAAALLAVSKGAKIVRVHDVAQTVDALKIWHAIQN